MSCTTWTPREVASEARRWAAVAWRIVEAQHVASTMKLVDDAAEQDVLESLLETGKPPAPPLAPALHYLLAAPFRYDPPPGGSRFRGVGDPGVFYAAERVRTACAELGYWRWRFLEDAVDLVRLEPVAHTAFCVDVATTVVDLRRPPFDKDAACWTHPTDYGATQAFARTVRETTVGGIVYRSVRDARPSWCIAVLTPAAFARRVPDPVTQTWWLAVQAEGVVWRRDDESLVFPAADWMNGATR